MMTVRLIHRHLKKTTNCYQNCQSSDYLKNPLKIAFCFKYYPSRAMRYYRIWIYTCNAALFICVIGFVIVAWRVLIADPRRLLIPGFSLSHPSILYVYFAVIMQCGLVQLVGCIGARKLNRRLLNTYWYLLLFLLLGDIILGVYYINQFKYIVAIIKPVLKQRFDDEYTKNEDFTALWDMVQREDQCCGVVDYMDFFPNSTAQNLVTPIYGDPYGESMANIILPESCCGASWAANIVQTTIKPPEALRRFPSTTSTTSTTLPPFPPSYGTVEPITVTDYTILNGITIKCSTNPDMFYTTGCGKRLIKWFRHSLDTLVIVGYCVNNFLKMCFVFILRYEIREMIQKIKILKAEQKRLDENPEIITPIIGQKGQGIRRYDHNGSVVGVAQPLLSKDENNSHSHTRMDDVITRGDDHLTSTSPLLLLRESSENNGRPQSTPVHIEHNIINQPSKILQLNDESDGRKSSKSGLLSKVQKSSNNNNNNNNYEVHEMQDLDRILVLQNRNKTLTT